MDISKINSSVLRSLLKLTEKRDALLAEVAKIDALIANAVPAAASSAAPTASQGKRGRKAGRVVKKTAPAVKAPSDAVPSSRKPAADKSSGKRGALKTKILAALRAAGDKGVSVKELSSKLGVKNQNIHVWFSSTGKKLGTIQKVGTGNYRLKPGA